jgi:hypothetical protein
MLLPALVLFAFSTHADSEDLIVTKKTGANGKQMLCLKTFPATRTAKARCVSVTAVTNLKLNPSDTDPKITELNLEALGFDSNGKRKEFGAIIEWKGKGAGVLSISGPKGKLFAVGSVVPNTEDPQHSTVIIEQFSDESLSEQYDRAVLFGESDPLRLHARTKIWLEGVLGPAIEQAVNPPESKSIPDRP